MREINMALIMFYFNCFNYKRSIMYVFAEK